MAISRLFGGHGCARSVPVLAVSLLVSGLFSTPCVWAQSAGLSASVTPSGLAASNQALPSGSGIDYDPVQQTLMVHVEALPLQQLLQRVSELTEVRFHSSGSKERLNQRVTRSFGWMPLERGIRQLLGRANTAMLYAETAEASGTTRVVLSEVHILNMGKDFQPITTSRTPVSSSPVPSVHTAPVVARTGPLPTPEERAARRAANQKQREDKEGNEATKRSSRRGRIGGKNNVDKLAATQPGNTVLNPGQKNKKNTPNK